MEIQNENQQSHINQRTQQNNKTNLYISSFIVNFSIQQIIQLCFDENRKKQLMTYLPKFQHNDFMILLNQFINQSVPNYGTLKPSKIKEQDPSDIIKIDKDNLSPKQLASQHPQKDQNIKQLLDLMSPGGSKKLNITNRSSFLKRKSSIISQIPVALNTQRSKIQSKVSLKSNDTSLQKIQKSTSIKKDPLQNFTSLATLQNQDPQILHLREIVQFNIKEKQKQQKIHNDRLKQDQDKLQSFNSQYGNNGLFTFDFDGQAIGSDTLKQQKLNYYAMRVGVKTLGKKFRTIYKHLQSNNQQNKKQEFISTKSPQQRKYSLQNSSILNSNSQIPMFQRQNNTFRQQIDPSKLKIIQYKRLYGRKFSRYDKNSMTLDLSTMMDKKIPEDDLFTSKRHLTDSLSINKSHSSSVNKQYVPRKLALPKLQGKYKVLDRFDRYDQI